MNTRSLPIKYGSATVCRRWHDIELAKPDGDRTEAMNQPGGHVLVRTTMHDTEWSGEDSFCSTAVATSLIRIEDTMVAKRWLPQVVDAWIDEEDRRHHPGMILVDEELALVPVPKLAAGEHGLLKTDRVLNITEFRWFDADTSMPRPTEEQIRAVVENLPPPNEVESLHREVELIRGFYEDAELRVSEARGAKDDDDPWVWSDDDTAQSVDSLGNLMVVKITGGHLRALIEGSSGELRKLLALALAAFGKDKKAGRALCEAISSSQDLRVAVGPGGYRRTPAEVSADLLGHEAALELWSDAE